MEYEQQQQQQQQQQAFGLQNLNLKTSKFWTLLNRHSVQMTNGMAPFSKRVMKNRDFVKVAFT